MGFHGEALLAPRPTPKLEDHPLSAVRDCLFNLFAATLSIGGWFFLHRVDLWVHLLRITFGYFTTSDNLVQVVTFMYLEKSQSEFPLEHRPFWTQDFCSFSQSIEKNI